MRRSQFLTVMGVLLVPGMLLLLAPSAWAGSAGLAAKAPSEAPAPALTGTCIVKKVSFAAVETNGQLTASTTFVDIPNYSVGFTMGGVNPSCLKVEFAAMAFAQADELIFVRALLDGATVGSPTDVQFDGDSDEDVDGAWSRSHAMNFAFNNVAPGAHTVTIQFRSFGGNPVVVHRGSLYVNHK